VLLLDEYVRDGSLASEFSKGVLDVCSVIDLIEIDRVEIGAQIRQEVLGSFAIRAVGLAEDSDSIVVNDSLGLDFGSRHSGGGCRCCEESGEERNVGQRVT